MELIDRASYQINPCHLREIRQRVGLSQTKLAALAGYSARLIRKAESTGQLSGATINDLVQALNEEGAQVTVSDLLFNEISTCVRLRQALEQHGREALQYCGELLADDFVYHCAGSPENPLAGTFFGREGFQQWLNAFYGRYQQEPGHKRCPKYFRNDHEVLVCYDEVLTVDGSVSPTIWVNLHISIRQGRIHSILNQYDTEAAFSFLLDPYFSDDASTSVC